MSQLLQETVASRAAAYDEVYRQWHAKKITVESFESWARFFLDVNPPTRGHLNGDEIQCAMRVLGVERLAGKRVLDLCCGTGRSTIYFALKGARVDGIDASQQAIEIANESAKLSGVEEQVEFEVMDVCALAYPDRHFDAIYCQSALHILIDYAAAPAELARVLKPGGVVVFCEEALGHNPLMAPFRWMRRRRYRECGGRPLTYDDLRNFGKPFDFMRVHHFNLLSQLKMLLGERAFSSGWRDLLRTLNKLDSWLIRAMPWIERWCGKIVVEYRLNEITEPRG